MGLVSDVVGDVAGTVEEAGSVVRRTARDATSEAVRAFAGGGAEAGLVGGEIRVARDVVQAPTDVERALLGKLFGVRSGELDGYAAQLRGLAEQVESLRTKISAALAESRWTGAAASAFTAVGERRVAQLGSLVSDLRSAAASVHTLALAF
jgi:hypothetical protein